MTRHALGLPFATLAAGMIATPLMLSAAHAQMTNQPPAPDQRGTPSATTNQPTARNQSGTDQLGMNTPASRNTVGPDATGRALPTMNVSRTTITRAGKAMHNVLAINKTYGAKLNATTDPATKQQIVATAKQKAMVAIKDQGLTIGQYNQVLASAARNPVLRQQLLNTAGFSASN